MPLIAGNVVVTADDKSQIATPPDVPVIAQSTEVSPHHSTVVIGGKQKTIAKSSQYLLDMISVENI